MCSWKRSVRARGFTVLELMVVVVIMALLVLVSTPRLFGVRDRSHLAAAQSDVTVLRHALAMYAADHDCYPRAIASYTEFRLLMVDCYGHPYVTLPSGETFRWLSYFEGNGGIKSASGDNGYVLKIQALDHKGTKLRATANDLQIG